MVAYAKEHKNTVLFSKIGVGLCIPLIPSIADLSGI